MASDIEQDLIDNEPPGLFPEDANSLWGNFRGLIADYLQVNAIDLFSLWEQNLDPRIADVSDLPEWEERLGIPVSDANKTDTARREFITMRIDRGPFTRDRRDRLIEAFISATFGDPLLLFTTGVPLDALGAPILSDKAPVLDLYVVIEDVENFTYQVRIQDDVDVDVPGLTRELRRITPGGIDFTIIELPAPVRGFFPGDLPGPTAYPA